MTSAPNDTTRRQYQRQCIRNQRLDDVDYTDLAPIERAKVRLRRAYVVAGVLIGISFLTAVVPGVYVASIIVSRSSGSETNDGKWEVCWPCRYLPTGTCCATLPKTDFKCNTITAVMFHCFLMTKFDASMKYM